MSWGAYGALTLMLVTWGMRRTIMGEAGGKRLVLSFGLIWCLECSWLSGSVCLLFIAFLGEVLKVAQVVFPPTPPPTSHTASPRSPMRHLSIADTNAHFSRAMFL